MRLFKVKETYYITIKRGKHVSLHTKDKNIATKLFEKFEIETRMLRTYQLLLKEYQDIITEIEKYHEDIRALIDKNEYIQIESCAQKERTLQSELVPHIVTEFNLQDVRQYVKCPSGEVDILGHYEGRKIIIELKVGSLKEEHLGQCLRYLNDKQIIPDEVWLMGSHIKPSASVFGQFDKIKLFTVGKRRKGKKDGYLIRQRKFQNSTVTS